MSTERPASLRLWHLTESRFSRRSPQFATHTSAFTVQRPNAGYAHTTARCPRCGTEFQVRISSTAELRRARRGWALAFTAGVLAVAGGVVLVLATALVWPAVVLLVGGFLIALVAGFAASAITGARPESKPGSHVVRRNAAGG